MFRALIAGVALIASLAVSAPATAATSLNGRVVGRPALHGAARAAGARDAVASQQAPVLEALAGERDATLAARTGLEDAVTQLDRAILDVGGASAPALPLETVSAVNKALHAIMDVLDETDVDVPLVDRV